MSPLAAALIAVLIGPALIGASILAFSRSRIGPGQVASHRVAIRWRVVGAFSPSLFVIGAIGLFVWARGVLGLQPHTAGGSWAVLIFGVALTAGSVVGYVGFLRRRRAARPPRR